MLGKEKYGSQSTGDSGGVSKSKCAGALLANMQIDRLGTPFISSHITW